MALTKRQLEVVAWLVERNLDDEPISAVKEGLVSQACLYTRWGLTNVKAWCRDYRAQRPPPPLSEADVGQRLAEMVPAAVGTIQSTLDRGKGDRVAVDLAKWILGEVYAKKPVTSTPALGALPAPDEEEELANVLRLHR
jgi:hypothetical protein